MSEIGENLGAVTSGGGVDRMNSAFYDQIQYPGPVVCLERFGKSDLFPVMLSQDIGYWNPDEVLPADGRIWVAGCGRNQALITALRFPEHTVVGSDLSGNALATCQQYARQMGVDNLELRNESLNEVSYCSEFDYVLCTGVVHHNARPDETLLRVARALKPSAVLELMVYNQYHRRHSAAFQQVVRLLTGNVTSPDYVKELPIAKKLVDSFDEECSMTPFLKGYAGNDKREAFFADTLLQPVEHSYSVQGLVGLASRAGLDVLMPCVDQFSRDRGAVSWDLDFTDPEVLGAYLELPDATRWHITNLLLQEKSPMLWFYFQREDSPRRRRTGREICDDFLERRFRRVTSTRRTWVLGIDGTYAQTPRVGRLPLRMPALESARSVFEALIEDEPIGETFRRVGLDTSFLTVNRVRVSLATSGFPFIETASLR